MAQLPDSFTEITADEQLRLGEDGPYSFFILDKTGCLFRAVYYESEFSAECDITLWVVRKEPFLERLLAHYELIREERMRTIRGEDV